MSICCWPLVADNKKKYTVPSLFSQDKALNVLWTAMRAEVTEFMKRVEFKDGIKQLEKAA